jgi:hypothetical protein
LILSWIRVGPIEEVLKGCIAAVVNGNSYYGMPPWAIYGNMRR